MRKYLILILLMSLQMVVHGQTIEILDSLGLPHPTKAKSMRYWFNDDSSITTVNSLDGSYTIDATTLMDGLNTIHYQIIDNENKVGAAYSGVFLKIGSEYASKAATLRYWFDDATNVMTCNANIGVQALDVSGLLDGLHTLHYQVVDTEGRASYIASNIFLKMKGTASSDNVSFSKLIYWFDDQQETRTIEAITAVQMLDVSTLLDGLHTLHCIAVCNDGSITSAYSSIFLRINVDTESTIAKKIRYWFDDDTDVKTTSVAGGTQTLDVSGLMSGLHTLHYQLVDNKDNVCAPVSGIFFKQYDKVVESEENLITQYMYWMNDNSLNNQKVKLDKPSSPYQLIALLPTIKAPIRSSSFLFEPKDGVPMIYAKNDLHVRFEDAAGYWVDDARSFVDYSVSEKVTDVAQLKSTQTFTRPDENGIKWFKFDAAPGDTIAFRSSQATSLQVFAPSGNEIFSASGDKSVKYGGAHTWETGTYYVAVHDVTGSKPNVILDYMHMDKYDVVSQDVHVVGNGGCSTITFQGNGFRDLYAVDLKDSKGNIIEAIDVGHESDATTTVTFDFTSAKLGKYNAVFHFTEEDKVWANNITVEEVKEIELTTRVTYPSTFLRGTSITYTVEITNKGNMTAYTVPIDLRIIADSFDNINTIHFGGNLASISIPECLDLDSLEQEVLDIIKEVITSADDRCQFIVVNDSINHKDYGFAQIIATIAPNTTQKLQITIQSNSTVALLAYTAKNWFSVSATENTIRKVRSAKAPSNNSLCCMKEQFQCAADIIASFGEMLSAAIPGVAGGNINCGTAVATTTISLAFDIGCSDGENLNERMRNYAKSNAGSLANKLIGTLVNCVTGYYKTIWLNLRESKKIAIALKNWNEVDRINAQISRVSTLLNGELTRIYKGINSSISRVNCFTLSADPIPGCPPNPGGGGGSSFPLTPHDPNDIYGYIAPSGSLSVGEDILNLPYRIEFENDTTFATASAHTVIVKDTLDAKVFDLSSYQPTSIKIGDKSVQLKGDKNFVTTVDMRPAINTIAQVEGLYDDKKGIVTWKFTSLDPMTMEETNDVTQGLLPVNYDGSGIGEVAYNINLKPGLADGTEIKNRASIVFDANDAILTPTWTNTIDAIPPVTHVSDVEQVNDTIVRVHFDGEDNRSGIWKYALYVQYGDETSWFQVAETDTTCIDFRFYEDLDYGFCVVATDSAGNVENKIIQREYKFLNGEGGIIDNITSPYKKKTVINRAYDLSGRLIQEEGYRGIIIKNRKKLLKR